MPWVGLQCVTVVFPDHTQLLLDMMRFKRRKTKSLIRLHGCAGRSALLLFWNPWRHVTYIEAHIIHVISLINMHSNLFIENRLQSYINNINSTELKVNLLTNVKMPTIVELNIFPSPKTGIIKTKIHDKSCKIVYITVLTFQSTVQFLKKDVAIRTLTHLFFEKLSVVSWFTSTN